MSADKEFYEAGVKFFANLYRATEAPNRPVFSKHRIYIHQYQNGWFISREPLHYECAGWVATTREQLHKLLDQQIDAVECEKEKK